MSKQYFAYVKYFTRKGTQYKHLTYQGTYIELSDFLDNNHYMVVGLDWL